MNTYMLQCAIRAALEPAVATLPLLTKPRPQALKTPAAAPTAVQVESTRAAKIYIGDVWPKQTGPEESVPFICLQERGGHDADSMTTVEIIIRCAVYSLNPEEATHELANLVSTVRHALLTKQHSPLECQYRLLIDDKGRLLPWESPTEQTHPYAESYILSVWEYKSIEGVLP